MRFLAFCLIILTSCNTGRNQSHNYIKINKGNYVIGSSGHSLNNQRTVQIEDFLISPTEVTNEQFSTFVNETQYITTAEQFKNAMTFKVGLDEFEWMEDSTANWQYPFGIESEGIEDKMNHPVSCISYMDAIAYCEWSNERLPTLDEWEVACRAGSDTKYFWGTNISSIRKFGNVWINKTHKTVEIQDDYLFTAPVKSYEPNPWGLYDIYGNVFEFCSDKISILKEHEDIACARGGSWWCSEMSCSFFNSEDIGRVNKFASFSNHGFRTVKK